MADGIALRSTSHPTPFDINPDSVETVEIDLPDPVCLRSVYGDAVAGTDNVIMSDQLARIEVLLIKMLAEMRK